MRGGALFGLGLLVMAASGSDRPASADVSMDPHALQHYSFCVGAARDDHAIVEMDRYRVYRCHGDIAISYFNYLGRRGVADQRVEEYNGVFLYRRIAGGVGRCWNRIADEAFRPVSEYGCDIQEEL
ncbi:hypothetical protein [Methylosinus sp. Sm6]|uniref:hypothetical protein n=1 Tax=Methylosinus sp. Sm6 TaxID=2866948 RepID=UPI001C9942AC|nr:hypothetical protein [Methylosinus sp. Sm6]MBY6242695.1 hypothetical protein [Methylosinus sp. Sm6]